MAIKEGKAASYFIVALYMVLIATLVAMIYAAMMVLAL